MHISTRAAGFMLSHLRQCRLGGLDLCLFVDQTRLEIKTWGARAPDLRKHKATVDRALLRSVILENHFKNFPFLWGGFDLTIYLY